MAALPGCASYSLSGVEDDIISSTEELTDTPFYPQDRYQCGPAALLTVLRDSGAQSDMATLVRQVYLPAQQGSLQPEMLAATRAAGRVPYRIDGSLVALAKQLRADRPVLVLQNLGVRWLPRWHYAVVIGVHAESREAVLRSGTERRRITALSTFMRTWARSGYWAFVVLRPEDIPADVDRERWFEALTALEQTGHAAAARRGWQAAVERWPASGIAAFGLANSEFALGNWQAAEAAYRDLLALDTGSAIAGNNLAMALLRQQRYADAEQAARRALDAAGEPAVRREIRQTLEEIRAARAPATEEQQPE